MPPKNPLRVAFQMDPIQNIRIDTDSTFALGLEALARGYTLYHYLPEALRLEDGRVTATAHSLYLRREYGNHYTLGAPVLLDLKADVDLVLLRQDPPFDMAYITSTHILEHIAPHTLVLNDPAQVRNAPEKLLVTHYPHLAPPTLITADKEAIRDFYARHGDVILKPLYGNGGLQIIRLERGSENLNSVLDMFSAIYREPIIAQKYLPEVRAGDKRIILIDGEPAGCMLRVPAVGETRSNTAVGGTPVKSDLSARDKEICAAIGPELRRRGLVFVGIDVIGDYLTEINVTSPTGIRAINALNGDYLEAKLWDAFEKRLGV